MRWSFRVGGDDFEGLTSLQSPREGHLFSSTVPCSHCTVDEPFFTPNHVPLRTAHAPLNVTTRLGAKAITTKSLHARACVRCITLNISNFDLNGPANGPFCRSGLANASALREPLNGFGSWTLRERARA